MGQSKDMDNPTPTPVPTETPAQPISPTQPVVPAATVTADPYAPVAEAQPLSGYDVPGYGVNQPNTVAEQISTLGQAEQAPTPIVPLAHTVEEPVAPMPMPVETVSPAVGLTPVVPEPAMPVPASTPPVLDTPAAASTVNTDGAVSARPQSIKTLILLVLVFVVLFGLAAVLGYMVGSHQG